MHKNTEKARSRSNSISRYIPVEGRHVHPSIRNNRCTPVPSILFHGIDQEPRDASSRDCRTHPLARIPKRLHRLGFALRKPCRPHQYVVQLTLFHLFVHHIVVGIRLAHVRTLDDPTHDEDEVWPGIADPKGLQGNEFAGTVLFHAGCNVGVGVGHQAGRRGGGCPWIIARTRGRKSDDDGGGRVGRRRGEGIFDVGFVDGGAWGDDCLAMERW